MNPRTLPPVLALLAILPAAGALSGDESRSPEGLSVSTLAGEEIEALRLGDLGEGSLEIVTASGNRKLKLDEVIALRFRTPADPPTPPDASRVVLQLWSGERLPGAVREGDDEAVTLETALAGRLRIALDHLAGIRFPARLGEADEPPDLGAAAQTDVVHLTGGDRFLGTVQRFSRDGIVLATEGGSEFPVPFERMTALQLVAAQAPAIEGTTLDVALRDGMRVKGTNPRVAGGRLSVHSVSGFDVEVALTDVVAAHVLSPRVCYLSDLAPTSTVVVPFWKPVAGDPAVLYAPRMDRSFSGRALRSGGQGWLKGIGVFGGTTLTWDLAGGYREFRTWTGLDDGAGPLGRVVFEVLVDGERRWTSGLLRPAGTEGRGAAGPVDAGRIDVTGAKTLTLRVLTGDDEDPYPVQDEADWLGALLLR